jgi:hypothetical protein
MLEASKRLIILISLILLPTTLYAGPFLICDPQSDISKYEIEIDGVIYSSIPEDLGNGNFRLHYDFGQFPVGIYNVRLRAGRVKSLKWGWSDWTPLFSIERELLPLPMNIALEE